MELNSLVQRLAALKRSNVALHELGSVTAGASSSGVQTIHETPGARRSSAGRIRPSKGRQKRPAAGGRARLWDTNA